jgi:hypothetical protein
MHRLEIMATSVISYSLIWWHCPALGKQGGSPCRSNHVLSPLLLNQLHAGSYRGPSGGVIDFTWAAVVRCDEQRQKLQPRAISREEQTKRQSVGNVSLLDKRQPWSHSA